jgi:carbonic anhydrase
MNRNCTAHTEICNCQHNTHGRRAFLGQGLAAATCAATGWLRHQAAASAAPPASAPDIAPSDALKKLYDGNQRFATGKPLAEHRDMKRVQELAEGQKPFAAFLGCADSRVPIEIVFDQGFGDLFVTRIAGNVACSENIGSLEFGTRILGAKVLYVLGHTQCGAVHATIKGDEVPGQISGLFQDIRPAIRNQPDLAAAVTQNVRNQALLLAESSPVIGRLLKTGELIIASSVYDLKTGLVTPVELGL